MHKQVLVMHKQVMHIQVLEHRSYVIRLNIFNNDFKIAFIFIAASSFINSKNNDYFRISLCKKMLLKEKQKQSVFELF